MSLIKLLVEGGAMQPGPTLSQQIGPLGLNMGQIISKINEATANFKGLKVPVELNIDAGTKKFDIKVFSPPVSELLKKELGIEKGSGEQKKKYSANASIEQVISVAKTKLPNMLCRNLTTAVKSVIGTCVSLGVLVEGIPASELGSMIDGGKFKKEIDAEKTQTSSEKRKKLDEQFKEIVAEQEKIIKAEEAAKEATKETSEAVAAPVAEESKETPKPETKPEKGKKPEIKQKK